jgi:hypothetical protein
LVKRLGVAEGIQTSSKGAEQSEVHDWNRVERQGIGEEVKQCTRAGSGKAEEEDAEEEAEAAEKIALTVHYIFFITLLIVVYGVANTDLFIALLQ